MFICVQVDPKKAAPQGKVRNCVNFMVYVLYISGGSSVGQNKLPQLILGYIYILKYLQSNFIG